MQRNHEPITSDPEAQAQWEAVVRAFHADVLRKQQAAQARLEAERRQAIVDAVTKERRRQP